MQSTGTAGLLFLEPHYSGIVIIAILTIVMLYEGGMKMKYLAMGFAALVVIVAVAAVTGLLTYAMQRMDGWGQALAYTSSDDPKMWNATWQTRNSLYAIGSGGLFGLGLGNSRQKYLYLPESQNDFVFAIVCEEIGYIGALIILLIFALLVWRGITLSLRAKDRFGKLLGIGLSAQIGIQVVLNILVITDWLPNTGISLPFFSYGGSSLIMLLAQMGLVLSVSITANISVGRRFCLNAPKPADIARGHAMKRPTAPAPSLSDQLPSPTITLRTSPERTKLTVIARRVPERVFHASFGWLACRIYPSDVGED